MSDIELPEYIKLAETFTAGNFKPKEWAALARRAGMKYITLTTRHHDGFSLYDTRGLSEWDAVHSGAGRDLIAEFVEGCRSEGITPFFYHTTLDWYQDSFRNDFSSYLKYLRDSVEILCTNYGPVGGFWFDGWWSMPEGTDWEEDQLYEVIRKHQEHAIIINNPGWTRNGLITHRELDSRTWEGEIPSRPAEHNEKGKYVAAECETSLSTWGHKKYHFEQKSPATVIGELSRCRQMGSNYLLNLTPVGDGSPLKIQEAILESVGEWMNINGEAVRWGRPSQITGSGSNFVLKGENGKYYFFCKDNSPLAFKNLPSKPVSLKWTDNSGSVPFAYNSSEKIISFENQDKDQYGSLIFRVAEAEIEVNYSDDYSKEELLKPTM